MATIEDKILTILKEYYPDLDSGPGTPFYELVVRPMAFLWEQHEIGKDELIAANTLENFDNMSREDLDRLMTRVFVERKSGTEVYGTIRIVFNKRTDYFIPKGTSVEASGKRYYATISDTFIPSIELIGNPSDGYYVDIGVVSQGKGNMYNAVLNELVSVYGDFSPQIRTAFFSADTTDGGIVEDNRQLYYRAKNSLTLKNLGNYRSIRALLLERFNLREVVPIGLRDNEMRRDLIDLPGVGIVHRGGLGDIYVRAEPYSISSGYKKPLGFPYSYKGKSIVDDPYGLLTAWNVIPFDYIDIYTRGSMQEELSLLSSSTDMQSLSSNVRPIQDFCINSDYEHIHCDNLVKQMWPLVVRMRIRISDDRGAGVLNAAKSAVVNYVSSLTGASAPKEAEIAHVLRAAGVQVVHLPMEVEAYYLTENLVMEKIGFGKVRLPASSLLKPILDDSLEFVVDDNAQISQISQRTSFWYTNADLITIEVV